MDTPFGILAQKTSIGEGAFLSFEHFFMNRWEHGYDDVATWLILGEILF